MRVVSFLHFKVIAKVLSGTAAPPCCHVDEKAQKHVLWVLRAHVILLGFFWAVSLLLPGFNLQRWIEHKRERDGIVAMLGNLLVHKSESFWKYFGGQAWDCQKELCITVLLTQKLYQCFFLHCLPAEH